MAAYDLTGSGDQALSADVGALRINVSVEPPFFGVGRAYPPSWFDIGLIRPRDSIDSYRPIPIDAQDMMLALPGGCTSIGYALFGGAHIHVVEVFGPSPFAGPTGPTGPSGPAGAAGAAGAAGSTLIARTVLSATTASITFAGIPNTYRHLEVYYSARGTAAQNNTSLCCQCNSDTAANYNSQQLTAFGSTVSAVANAGATSAERSGQVQCANSAANAFAQGDILFVEYANTSAAKNWIGRAAFFNAAGSGNYGLADFGGFWGNSAAITDLKFFPLDGSFAAGTVFELVGVV